MLTAVTTEKNAYQVALHNFDVAANALGLHEDIRAMIKYPERVLTVSLPVRMDRGRIRRFEGPEGGQDMNRRNVRVPDWNASMLEIGDDMGVDDDGTRWVVEKVSEAYMTTDGQSWVQITLVEAPSAKDGD